MTVASGAMVSAGWIHEGLYVAANVHAVASTFTFDALENAFQSLLTSQENLSSGKTEVCFCSTPESYISKCPSSQV